MTRAAQSFAIAAATVIVELAASGGRARAEPDTRRLAAVAGAADDVRASVLVGPSGQVYEPDGHGAWIRHTEGGIAATVTIAVLLDHAGSRSKTVIAGGVGSPPYRFADGAWTALHVARGTQVVGSGARALVAAGREIFAIDRGTPTHLANAPAAVTAIASGAGVAIATAQGAYRLDGTRFHKLDLAASATLISDQWAIDAHGVILVPTGAQRAWPSDLAIVVAAPAADGTLAAVGTSNAGLELVVVHAKGAIDRAVVPLPHPSHAVGVAVDRAGRALVATADGQVATLDHGHWTMTTIRDDLPAVHPGAPPAVSH